MKRLLADDRCHTSIADLCAYGLTTTNKKGKKVPARKKTKFLSSSREVLKKLDKRCDGKHEHGHFVDGKARAAALYPPELCRAIILGTDAELVRCGQTLPIELKSRLEKGWVVWGHGVSEEVVGGSGAVVTGGHRGA